MLSRLALSEEEIKLFAEQIDEIVGASPLSGRWTPRAWSR